ncbi:hypothetical protein Trydic_g11894 [Trypoxylus dichotomus]
MFRIEDNRLLKTERTQPIAGEVTEVDISPSIARNFVNVLPEETSPDVRRLHSIFPSTNCLFGDGQWKGQSRSEAPAFWARGLSERVRRRVAQEYSSVISGSEYTCRSSDNKLSYTGSFRAKTRPSLSIK